MSYDVIVVGGGKSEFLRRAVDQTPVRPAPIVIRPPCPNRSLCVFHLDEPVRVQAFISQPSVKRLDVRVVRWLAKSGEVNPDLVHVSL